MPELPEVEYTRRQLQRAMTRARIARVIAHRPNLRYALPRDFDRVEGQLVRAVGRRAKYLLVAMASGDILLIHLGMSGSFRVVRGCYEAHDYERHDHVVFEMSNDKVVICNDPRRFGFMSLLTADEAISHASLGLLGPEPLARTFDAAALAKELGRRKTSLKIALSDQRVIAGLGNIYVSEALHRAGLSPKRRASTLVTKTGAPRPALNDLVTAIRETLKNAIRNQYRTGADDPFVVYEHEGERCPRRGCQGTIRRIVQGGRSTFYCPVCQR